METIVYLYVIGVVVAAILHKQDLKKDFMEKGSFYPDSFIWSYILAFPKRELFYSWITVVNQLMYRAHKND